MPQPAAPARATRSQRMQMSCVGLIVRPRASLRSLPPPPARPYLDPPMPPFYEGFGSGAWEPEAEHSGTTLEQPLPVPVTAGIPREGGGGHRRRHRPGPLHRDGIRPAGMPSGVLFRGSPGPRCWRTGAAHRDGLYRDGCRSVCGPLRRTGPGLGGALPRRRDAAFRHDPLPRQQRRHRDRRRPVAHVRRGLAGGAGHQCDRRIQLHPGAYHPSIASSTTARSSA